MIRGLRECFQEKQSSPLFSFFLRFLHEKSVTHWAGGISRPDGSNSQLRKILIEERETLKKKLGGLYAKNAKGKEDIGIAVKKLL